MGTPTDSTAPHPQTESPLTRVVRWEDRTAWPLFAASVILLGATTWAFAVEDTPVLARGMAAFIALVLWLVFIADYLVRLGLAGTARGEFFRSRVFELVTLILPFIRPLLIVVYVWRLPVFRYGGPAKQRLRYLVTLSLFSLMFVYLTAWGVWLVERNAPGATILSFDDALFWGFTTITTVGYGNLVPVTALGRILAVGLMLGGLVVIGVTSATVVSALTDRIRLAASQEPPARPRNDKSSRDRDDRPEKITPGA